jgi:twitching motility protein PilI
MAAGESLNELRDRPMDLLAELEKRGRAATASPETPDNAQREWVGVALRLGGEMYLIAREEVREVLGVPAPLTRVPGARAWILGIANVRGQLLPVIDLRHYLGAGATPTSRGARVVVANHRDIPAGLVVDEVLGFRRFSEAAFTSEVPSTIVPCAPFLAGSFPHEGQPWPVLSLRKLLEDPTFVAGAA